MSIPDTFDIKKFPVGVVAGDNKFGWFTCPTCGKKPTHPTKDQYPWPSDPPEEGFFMFRNKISAREYYISGMCQTCQDKIFGAD